MTTTSSQATVAVPNVGPVMYDQIMSGIDPELCSEQIPFLKEKYKNETKEDWMKRAKRYNEAFAAFDVIAAQHTAEMNIHKNEYRRQALLSAEKESRVEETQKLQEMESLFS